MELVKGDEVGNATYIDRFLPSSAESPPTSP